MNLSKKKVVSTVKTTLFVLMGNALLAFVVAAFIIPHDIIMGGTTGIAIVLNKSFGIDTALMILIMNIILLIAGLLIIGKKLFFTSVASTVMYPVMLSLIQRIPGIDSLTDNRLLAALFAGVLMGLSLGLVMRVGSSTGGMDIMNLILAKLTHRSVAVYVYITDIIVVGAQAIVSDSESILLGIVVLVLESLILEQVMIFGKSQLELFIISEKYEEIKLRLLKELRAGVTMSYIQTGFKGEDAQGIICVIHPRKLYMANEIVRSIDPEAFITVTKIKEVTGRGFTAERRELEFGKDE
ncbi:MAG: YitT family protein [Ruminococcaceae bacterium]|nr:YitT family protein [Oscillospiraceae bacterium]